MKKLTKYRIHYAFGMEKPSNILVSDISIAKNTVNPLCISGRRPIPYVYQMETESNVYDDETITTKQKIFVSEVIATEETDIDDIDELKRIMEDSMLGYIKNEADMLYDIYTRLEDVLFG